MNNNIQYDRRFHSGPCKGTCPICKKRSYYLHLPHLLIFRKSSFRENEIIAKSVGIYPIEACLDCYKGELK